MSCRTGYDPQEAIFTTIYERHYSRIYAYYFGRTGNTESALDLLQETFTRAWRHIAQLRTMTEEQHAYWLFAVAKNILTDSQRRQTRWQTIEQELISVAQARGHAQVPIQGKQQAAIEELILLEEAIAHLPEHLRTVLSMSVLGEMNSTEIGAALDLPAGTVRYQLSVARKQLIDYLEQG